jgi:hypothetical protein
MLPTVASVAQRSKKRLSLATLIGLDKRGKFLTEGHAQLRESNGLIRPDGKGIAAEFPRDAESPGPLPRSTDDRN